MRGAERTHQERLELFKASDLYPVVSSEFCNGRPVYDMVSEIAAGGAKIVQIREKNISDCAVFELVQKCKSITDRYNMLLIVDDRLDVAIAAGADGVHLGQEDLPVKRAREIAPEMLFGVSTHNEEETAQAQAEGCSYLNMGPVFPTRTKSVPCGALGLETVSALKHKVFCPFSVMGGIKEEHLELLVSKGFPHIAMVTEITQALNVQEKVKHLRGIMLKALSAKSS